MWMGLPVQIWAVLGGIAVPVVAWGLTRWEKRRGTRDATLRDVTVAGEAAGRSVEIAIGLNETLVETLARLEERVEAGDRDRDELRTLLMGAQRRMERMARQMGRMDTHIGLLESIMRVEGLTVPPRPPFDGG